MALLAACGSGDSSSSAGVPKTSVTCSAINPKGWSIPPNAIREGWSQPTADPNNPAYAATGDLGLAGYLNDVVSGQWGAVECPDNSVGGPQLDQTDTYQLVNVPNSPAGSNHLCLVMDSDQRGTVYALCPIPEPNGYVRP